MMDVSQAKRLKKEKARLKRIVADQVLGLEILQEALERLIGIHGTPEHIRSDNGSEIIRHELQEWPGCASTTSSSSISRTFSEASSIPMRTILLSAVPPPHCSVRLSERYSSALCGCWSLIWIGRIKAAAHSAQTSAQTSALIRTCRRRPADTQSVPTVSPFCIPRVATASRE